MRLGNNILKSGVLATVIFWIILLPDVNEDYGGLIFMISLIPIFLSVAIVIITTIFTVFTLTRNNRINNKAIFKNCFPYYAIITFLICAFGIYEFHFEIFSIAFFSSVFITTSQSWVWFSKVVSDEKV